MAAKAKAARRAKRGNLLRYWKLALAIVLDMIDLTAGRLFGLGEITDVALTFVAVLLFGWRGLIQLWELVEVTNQVDGFVPTLTLLALAERRRAKA